MPMTVEEHHIGQLYTVARQSVDESNESKGKTAVEILENGPFVYTDDLVAAMNTDGSVSAFESTSSTGTVDSDTAISDTTASSSAALALTQKHKLPATPLSRTVIRAGQYTSKVYHVGGNLPSWFRAIAPASVLKAEERAWNCYPYCRTVMTNPYLGERFHIVVETLHVDIDSDTGEMVTKVRLPGGSTHQISDPDNVFELPPNLLKDRQIYNLDICAHTTDPTDKHDPTAFTSTRLHRGPFASATLPHHSPRMLVFKLVTIRCAIFGVQTRAESLILESQCRLFHRFYRRTVCEMDEWSGLGIAEVRAIEEEARETLERALDAYNLPSRA